MKNLIIILAFMAFVLAACNTKKEDAAECDASAASSTDVVQGKGVTGGDATSASTDASGMSDILADGFPNVSDVDSPKDKAKECYNECIKTDMSKEDCKKSCYGDWTKKDVESKDKDKDAGADIPDDVSETKD